MGGGSGDQIKKIFQLFLDDLEDIHDLKCVLDFNVLNVLFKNFRSVQFLYKSFQHF